jgi:hypothetical protein
MSTVGEKVSGSAKSKAEVDRWAVEIADMLSAYIGRLAAQ